MAIRLITALLCLIPGLSIADEWLAVAKSVDGTEFFVKPSTIRNFPGHEGYVRALHKVVLPKSRAAEQCDSFRHYIQHDCIEHTTEIIEAACFKDGNSKGPRNIPKWADRPVATRPGTAIDIAHLTVCAMASRLDD